MLNLIYHNFIFLAYTSDIPDMLILYAYLLPLKNFFGNIKYFPNNFIVANINVRVMTVSTIASNYN